MRVFISYAREDKEVAKKLYHDLKSAGVEPWMDEYDLLVGQNWKHAITHTFLLNYLGRVLVFESGYPR